MLSVIHVSVNAAQHPIALYKRGINIITKYERVEFVMKDVVRRFGWIYFVGFLAIVAIAYIPAFEDADGNLFGLFKLDLYDNLLHLASGLWAGIAAWMSYGASRTYFRLFGPLYFADGVMGLFTGSGYLDGGIFLYGPLDLSMTTRFFANLPHLIIGGVAIWVGYKLAAQTRSEFR